MITTKYNFKLWLRRKYPDITATPIYGVPAYTLSKALSAEDMYTYNIQQLPSGQYIVFIGLTPDEIIPLMKKLQKGEQPVTRRFTGHAAPTTFASFEQWMQRNDIVPINRTFCNHMSASQALMTDDIINCTDKDAIKTWYMYELPIQNGTSLNEWEQEAYSKIPHVIVQQKDFSIVIVLIKACNSTYKSKKQRFVEKFQLMQPLYEKLISAAARAIAWDDINGSGGDWDTVKQLCEQYMGMQFEYEGTVDITALKEAAHEGILGFWTRDRNNFRREDSETL